MAYLTFAEFRQRTTMPVMDVEALEVSDPGFIEARLEARSSFINARLRKRRYAIPFTAPYPEVILDWVTALVTFDCYSKRGFDPSSKSDQEAIVQPMKDAKAELQEAANARDGAFDLPLVEDTSTSAVASTSGPLGYSEVSPYVWTDGQYQDSEDNQ